MQLICKYLHESEKSFFFALLPSFDQYGEKSLCPVRVDLNDVIIYVNPFKWCSNPFHPLLISSILIPTDQSVRGKNGAKSAKNEKKTRTNKLFRRSRTFTPPSMCTPENWLFFIFHERKKRTHSDRGEIEINFIELINHVCGAFNRGLCAIIKFPSKARVVGANFRIHDFIFAGQLFR